MRVGGELQEALLETSPSDLAEILGRLSGGANIVTPYGGTTEPALYVGNGTDSIRMATIRELAHTEDRLTTVEDRVTTLESSTPYDFYGALDLIQSSASPSAGAIVDNFIFTLTSGAGVLTMPLTLEDIFNASIGVISDVPAGFYELDIDFISSVEAISATATGLPYASGMIATSFDIATGGTTYAEAGVGAAGNVSRINLKKMKKNVVPSGLEKYRFIASVNASGGISQIRVYDADLSNLIVTNSPSFFNAVVEQTYSLSSGAPSGSVTIKSVNPIAFTVSLGPTTITA